MSGSKEKQNRQLKESETISKKEAAERERLKQRKKTRNTVIIIVVVVALLLAAALFINSKSARRNLKAISIGDMTLTAAEFEFYYFQFYYKYVQYVYENQYDNKDMLLPDTSQPLETQEYYGEGTWKDYFQNYAISNLKRCVGVYKEAQDVGFEMNDEQLAAIQNEMEGFSTAATYYGKKDVDEYLRAQFGEAANSEIAEKCLTFIAYCDAYDSYYDENLKFTAEEITAAYEANKGRFDKFEYRYMLVYSDTVDEADFGTDEEYQDAKVKAAKAAHEKAEQIQSGIKTEKDFIEAAREYDSTKYAEDDSSLRNYNGDVLGSIYGNWLRDESRVEGDTDLFDISTGTYIVYFIERTDNKYPTIDISTITVTPETINEADYEEDEDDSEYNAAVEEAKTDAYAEIENIEKEWLENGGTEEAFAQMIVDKGQYSSTIAGAEVDNVYRGQYTEDIEKWLFDDSRKEGDHFVTYSEKAGCYFLIYYRGKNILYNEYLANEELKRVATNDHESALIENVVEKKFWAFSLA